MSAAVDRPPDSAVVLFPGALGDFICLLPALKALRARHRGGMLVIAKPELVELIQFPDTIGASIDRREIADLFAGTALASGTTTLLGGFAHAYSWTGFGNEDFAARLRRACGGNARLYAFRGMRPGEHAADYYARCVGAAPAMLSPSDVACDAGWLAAFEREHHLAERRILVMHPGSGAARKNWQGFQAVAEHWRRYHDHAIVVVHGPAERETQPRIGGDGIDVDGLSLPQVAALLRRSELYLGNDSGVSHLAAVVGARGVAVFGPTDPAMWAPRGHIEVARAHTSCSRCDAQTLCIHRLPAERVIHALSALQGETPARRNPASIQP